MRAEMILVKKDHLTEIIERKDRQAIYEMIEAKEVAMLEAIENALFYRESGHMDQMPYAQEEERRAKMLQRQIDKLKSALSN